MVLTDKQKKDLNLAILEYLETNNYKESSLALQIESSLDYESNSTVMKDVLEKKWVSIIRLQKKVNNNYTTSHHILDYGIRTTNRTN